MCDISDVGLAGVTVTLNTTGVVVGALAPVAAVDQTTTNLSGNYVFSDISPGMYYVNITLPPGASFSPGNTDINTATGDSAAFSVPAVLTVTINAAVASRPTSIDLAAFSAHPLGAAKCGRADDGVECVRVVWRTVSERDVVGYRLLRSSAGREAALDVTNGLIAAQGADGAEYVHVDATLPAPGVYHYWLVDVSATGPVTEFGPVAVVVGSSLIDPGVPQPLHGQAH